MQKATPFVSLMLIVAAGGCGADESSRVTTSPRMAQEERDVKFVDKLKKRGSQDASSIRQMLEREGARPAEATEIVRTLSERLTPDNMYVWLAHKEKSHPIPDESTQEKFGTTLNWTPVNAIAAGKTDLVIAEARRFVGFR